MADPKTARFSAVFLTADDDGLGPSGACTSRWGFALIPLLGILLFGAAHAQDAPDGTQVAAVEETVEVGAEESSVPSADSTELSGEDVRDLRTVEEQVRHLKEAAYRSKTVLQLLKELVIEGSTLGSRVAIWHVNRLGGAYSIESVQYFLDGKNVYGKVDPNGSLNTFKELKVREQTVAPGTHGLQVHMVVNGAGYRFFTYVKSYQFKVQSSYSFEVEDGRLKTVRVVASSRGGAGRSFVDRLNVQYEERSERLKDE